MKLPAYILAGGESSRFGSDKARAVIEGDTLLGHATAYLEPFASAITVVAAVAGAYPDLGLRTIGDVVPARGPLGGLDAALRDARRVSPEEPWLVVTACDWLGYKSAWLGALLAAMSADPEAEVIAYRGDRWQPFPALYRSSLAGAIALRLEGDDRSIQSLIGASRSFALPLPGGWASARAVNAPPQP